MSIIVLLDFDETVHISLKWKLGARSGCNYPSHGQEDQLNTIEFFEDCELGKYLLVNSYTCMYSLRKISWFN